MKRSSISNHRMHRQGSSNSLHSVHSNSSMHSLLSISSDTKAPVAGGRRLRHNISSHRINKQISLQKQNSNSSVVSNSSVLSADPIATTTTTERSTPGRMRHNISNPRINKTAKASSKSPKSSSLRIQPNGPHKQPQEEMPFMMMSAQEEQTLEMMMDPAQDRDESESSLYEMPVLRKVLPRRQKSKLVLSSNRPEDKAGTASNEDGLSLLQLIQTKQKEEKRKRCQAKKSILKKQSSYSNLEQATGVHETGKSVDFARDPDTKTLCVAVHEYEATPFEQNPELWWTDEEVEARNIMDLEIANEWGRYYCRILKVAFDSCRTTQTESGEKMTWDKVDLTFERMANCAVARGLEIEIFPPMQDLRDKHLSAVLNCQDLMLANDCDDDDSHPTGLTDAELKLIRVQSLKVSRQSQMIAAKMAEFDALFARMIQQY